MNNLKNTITDYYFDLPYSDHYGYDIAFTLIITLIVVGICLFLYIKTYIQSYRNRWYKYKCHPFLMPFAGLVNPQGSTSKDMEYTYDNFKGCLDQFLEELLYHLKQPIKGTIDSFVKTVVTVTTYMNEVIMVIIRAIATVFDVLRNLLSRLKLFVTEIGLLTGNFLSFFGKVFSMITSFFYTLMALIKMLKLFFVLFAAAMFAATVVPTAITLGLSAAIFAGIIIISLVFPPFTLPAAIAAILPGVIMLISGVLLAIFIFIHSVIDEFAEDVTRYANATSTPDDAQEESLDDYYSRTLSMTTAEFLSLSSNEREEKKIQAIRELARIQRNHSNNKPATMPLYIWFKVQRFMEAEDAANGIERTREEGSAEALAATGSQINSVSTSTQGF